MKLLAINGSPRIGGNTDILLDRAVEGAQSRGAETEKIILNTLSFVPCQECENTRSELGGNSLRSSPSDARPKLRDSLPPFSPHCFALRSKAVGVRPRGHTPLDPPPLAHPLTASVCEAKRWRRGIPPASGQICLIKDDMQALYRKIMDADALLLASPIFFGNVSAQTKMMIDRFQCAWKVKYVWKTELFQKRKPGGFISVQASARKDFFENSRTIIRNVFATINVVYKEELFCPGVDARGSILEHPDWLNAAQELGARLVSIRETGKGEDSRR